MNVILYKGETCPKCKIVAMKLDQKGINYQVITDMDYMIAHNVTSIPTLEVDGKRYVGPIECRDWINTFEVNQ